MCELQRRLLHILTSFCGSVFVDGRDRPTLLEDMQGRIDRNDIALERNEAIKAMCQIAADRARKLHS